MRKEGRPEFAIVKVVIEVRKRSVYRFGVTNQVALKVVDMMHEDGGKL